MSRPALTPEQKGIQRIKEKIESLPDGIKEKVQAKYSGASAEQKEAWHNKFYSASNNFMKAKDEGRNKTSFRDRSKEKLAMRKRPLASNYAE